MIKTKLFLPVLLAIILLIPSSLIFAQEEQVIDEEIYQIQILEEIPTEEQILEDIKDDAPVLYDTEASPEENFELIMEDYDDELMWMTGEVGEDARDLAIGGGLAALLFSGIMIAIWSIFGLATYIFSALALQKIGKEMKYKDTWFAWVPILSTVMTFQLGNQNPLLLLLLLIPGIGAFIVMIFSILALMNISEKRGYDRLLGLLVLVPFGTFVLLYLLAWRAKEPVAPKVDETVTPEVKS